MPRKICKINELHLFEAHLLRLEFGDRQTRFQGYISDEAIGNYIKKIQEEHNHEILGKFCDDNVHIIGGAHVGIVGNCADLAFSVEIPYRGRGYGKLLFTRCLEVAKDFNCTCIHTDCFRTNAPMMNLARSFGLDIEFDGPDAFGDGNLSKICK